MEFKDKIKTLQFAGKKAPQTAMEKRWNADMPAYKNLRKNGLQPRGIDGCAQLEKHASTKMEIQMGHLLKTPEERKKAKEGLQRATDMGLGIDSG